MPNKLTHVKFTRSLNAVVAGTSAQTGTSVDMQGFDGVLFVAALGALTATQVTSLKAAQSSDNSSFADITGAITGAMADGDSNKLLVLDVFRPQQRFVRPVINRGTANAVIDGCIAIQYEAKKEPTVNDATTVSASKFLVGV